VFGEKLVTGIIVHVPVGVVELYDSLKSPRPSTSCTQVDCALPREGPFVACLCRRATRRGIGCWS
jgi:hypothetical protein